MATLSFTVELIIDTKKSKPEKCVRQKCVRLFSKGAPKNVFWCTKNVFWAFAFSSKALAFLVRLN
jgi:hypothetical protein